MSRGKPSSNDCHHFFVLVISPLLVLMEDQWKALNEKGVAVAYVGTKSVISPEIVRISNFYIYISYIFQPRRTRKIMTNNDISLKFLIF